jgi:hypothetical protein
VEKPKMHGGSAGSSEKENQKEMKDRYENQCDSEINTKKKKKDILVDPKLEVMRMKKELETHSKNVLKFEGTITDIEKKLSDQLRQVKKSVQDSTKKSIAERQKYIVLLEKNNKGRVISENLSIRVDETGSLLEKRLNVLSDSVKSVKSDLQGLLRKFNESNGKQEDIEVMMKASSDSLLEGSTKKRALSETFDSVEKPKMHGGSAGSSETVKQPKVKKPKMKHGGSAGTSETVKTIAMKV